MLKFIFFVCIWQQSYRSSFFLLSLSIISPSIISLFCDALLFKFPFSKRFIKILRVNGIMIKKPIVSVMNLGIINRIRANAIDAPDIISYKRRFILINIT